MYIKKSVSIKSTGKMLLSLKNVEKLNEVDLVQKEIYRT